MMLHCQLLFQCRPTIVCVLSLVLAAVVLSVADGKPRLRPRRSVEASGSTNCTGCTDRRTLADLRTEQIKQDLLRKLGFDRPPQVKPSLANLPPIGHNNPQVARLLKDARRGHGEMAADQPYLDEEEYSRPEKAYVFGREPPAKFGIEADKPVAYFEFSEATMAKDVHMVELNVHVRQPSADITDRTADLSIDVFERLKNGDLNVTPIAHKKIAHHRLGHERYVRVPLPTDVLRRWFDAELDEAGKDNVLGLFVRAQHDGENLAEHPQHGDEHSMYLELQTIDRDSSRRKRNAPEKCTADKNHPRCCLYDLEIDFEAAGWDFVIAPKRYNAQMCNGECRMGTLARYPHTKIMAQQAVASGQNGVGPCCHPTEYDSITLIYMTEEREVLISKIHGMIARRCGCA